MAMSMTDIHDVTSALHNTHLRDPPILENAEIHPSLGPTSSGTEEEGGWREEEWEEESSDEGGAALTAKEREELWYQKHKPRARNFGKLPRQYRVSPENPNPPLLHYGVAVTERHLLKYAVWAGEDIYMPPNNLVAYKQLHPLALDKAVKVLRETCVYNHFELADPYFMTPRCEVLVSLYTNYNYRGRRLIKEGEEDVIDMLKAELDLAPKAQPRWYFDRSDPWRPGKPE